MQMLSIAIPIQTIIIFKCIAFPVFGNIPFFTVLSSLLFDSSFVFCSFTFIVIVLVASLLSESYTTNFASYFPAEVILFSSLTLTLLVIFPVVNAIFPSSKSLHF